MSRMSEILLLGLSGVGTDPRPRTSLVPTDISQQREALHRGWGAARSATPQPREQENLQKILLPLQTTPSKCLIGPHTVPICHHLSLCQLYQNTQKSRCFPDKPDTP